MDDRNVTLESWVTEETDAFGLDTTALKYEVRRELMRRAAQRIAIKVEKQLAEEHGEDFASW
jgi:hypothetical protein